MTDGILFALGCGISFIFIAGAYVYIRETATQSGREVTGAKRPTPAQ